MERRMLHWWPQQNFTIAHGDGIFEHARLQRTGVDTDTVLDNGIVRVCFVHHALWVGGVERQMRLIIEGINRCVMGFATAFICNQLKADSNLLKLICPSE
jgi:hypothetical protein